MRPWVLGAALVALAGCSSHLNTVDQQLQSALAGEPVTITQQSGGGMLGGIMGGGGTITLESSADYLYPSGGYQLRPDAPLLSKMVPIFKQFQHTTITVNGYTDNQPVGPQLKAMGIQDNTDLSLRRASQVVSYFQSQGVNPKLLSAKGFGDQEPVGFNETAAGRAKNRRVDIVLNGDGT